MVSDVRFKMRMVAQNVLDTLIRQVKDTLDEQTRVAKAQQDYDTAVTVRAHYRSEIVRAFPGCRIAITRQHLSIWLPDRYPTHMVPIVIPLPPVLIECLSPRGLSSKSF